MAKRQKKKNTALKTWVERPKGVPGHSPSQFSGKTYKGYSAEAWARRQAARGLPTTFPVDVD